MNCKTGDESVDTDLAVDPDGSVKVKGDSNVTAGTPDHLVEVTLRAVSFLCWSDLVFAKASLAHLLC